MEDILSKPEFSVALLVFLLWASCYLVYVVVMELWRVHQERRRRKAERRAKKERARQVEAKKKNSKRRRGAR